MNKLLSAFTDPSSNLLQSDVWQDYEESLGNTTFRVSCDKASALLIKMPLYKDKNYLYCPRGPVCTKEGWHVFLKKARETALQENCVFVRVEPYSLPNGITGELKFRPVGPYSPLSKQFSPMDTQLLDISKRDDDLLLEMKPKWRYNIKLGYRKGVTVRSSSKLEDIKKFHELSVGMHERGYTPFGVEHYERLLYTLTHGKHIKLYIAEYQKQILSMILVTHYGKVATYLHGASSDDFRDMMPNHLVQWEAILDAQRAGCTVYDFWGVAPEGAENHSWAGITRFKKGFGGETVHLVGAFDYAFSPLWYNILHLYNFVRKITKKK
jgi:lipid II:glycine glycyltransferase (peptidoglycan interpeptide bridge formation enzyme)